MIPNEHTEYTIQDLLRQEPFREWVLNNDSEGEASWTNWMAVKPENARKVHVAKAILLNLQETPVTISDEEIDDFVADTVAENRPKVIFFWRSPAMRIAASILLVLGIGGFLYRQLILKPTQSTVANGQPTTGKYIENTNDTDKPVRILLSENSVITLYPNSSIKYPNPFEPTKRVVFLNGKAFFEISRNPKKPFWVHSDKLSTQVLGTSFMVNSFAKNADASVQVRSGKVSVYLYKDLRAVSERGNSRLTGVVLTTNQQATVAPKEERLVKSIVQQPELVATPANEQFVFDETPLKTVLQNLSSAYGISFTYDERTIENCYLTANLTEESLFEKLDLICRITHSTYEVVDAQIFIRSEGCN
ncbi:MAG: FecR family protein [Cytophagales bacterium]|nr:MAG: FecR family protein [Cytophagales bacterium]